MLYTSYYAKYNKMNTEGMAAVQVSNTAPAWFSVDVDWKKYAPKWSDINALKRNEIAED